jgi:diguanylate cyclase (GGDEF)-like protein/PAS domain S-box-containing protein
VAWALVGTAAVADLLVVQVHDVTDRKPVEARFRSLVQHSSDMVMLCDADGIRRYVSPASQRILGLPPEAMEGSNDAAVVHPDDAAGMAKAFVRALHHPGEPVLAECRVRHADGRWRWLEAVYTNLLDDPDVDAVVVNSRDITERREAEEALAAIVQNSPAAIYAVDPEGRVLLWNPACEALFGWTAEEAMGGPLPIVPEEAEPEFRQLRQRVLGGGTFANVQARRRRKDGTAIDLSLSAAPVRDADGRVVSIMAVTTDITDRIRAEAALRESEARFRSLVQNASDLISVDEEDGTIRYVSPSVEKILGYRPDELVGSHAFDVIHPDDGARLFEELTVKLAEPGSYTHHEYRARHRDGSWRHLEGVVTNMLHDPAVRGFVSNARDVTERRRADAFMRGQTRALEMIARGRPLAETLDLLAGLVAELIAGATAVVLLVDDTTGILRPGAGGAIGPVEGLSHRAVIVPDVTTDPRWAPHLADAEAAGVRACWSVPVSAQDGSALGAVVTYLGQARGPTGEELGLIGLSAYLAEIAVGRTRSQAQLAHQALHDPLTGLPNRTLFLDRLGHVLARRRPPGEAVAVLFVDLDRFKVVNDSLGHAAGDQLLVALAERLRHALRPADTVARFGGDEFTILCESVADAAQAAAIAARVGELIAQPFAIEGEDDVVLTASVGISLSAGGPDTGADRPETMLRDADAAMYRAKERGRARHELFDEQMRAGAVQRLQLEQWLRRAIERDELRVHFQPEVRLADGRVEAVEALLRWQHPERGLLLPADFLALAEETGLIVPVGAWVLTEACRWAARLTGAGPGGSSPGVWVNLSARQLAMPDLTGTVAEALAGAGIAPDRLCLEITESALMEDAEATLATLRSLKDLGVGLAVDDFGTGYSSLSYLRRFPVDFIKVDRSFVDGLGHDPEDTAIVAAVVGLAHSLGLVPVAEGIETAGQLAELRRLGCELGQGHLFAPPVPGEELRLSG